VHRVERACAWCVCACACACCVCVCVCVLCVCVVCVCVVCVCVCVCGWLAGGRGVARRVTQGGRMAGAGGRRHHGTAGRSEHTPRHVTHT
jgi:hypothetical protein